METFSLGNHVVGRVGFGAMQLPGPGVMGPPRDHDQAITVLTRALELGITTSTPPSSTDRTWPTS